MKRENRKNSNVEKILSDKMILYIGISVAIITVIIIGIFIYSKSLSDDVKDGTMSLEKMTNIASNNVKNTESASTEIGKTVEEAEKEKNNTTNQSSQNISNTTNNKTNSATTNQINKTNTNITTNTSTNKNTTINQNSTQQTSAKKELSFEKPVEGDVVREFAKDNLIYSETLKEWTTHLGIDIKADKTTVVKSAEAGVVKTIKNDPRYGLTIVIEHENSFQTVYSNLLTSEFVVEGEKVEKGQSIGTVGNSAAFEIADEPHLHFEILKDSVQVDPSIYIK